LTKDSCKFYVIDKGPGEVYIKMVDYRIGISCFIRINYVNKSQLIDVCKTYIIMQLLMISRSVKVSLLIKKI
jgi:hypothetical protein